MKFSTRLVAICAAAIMATAPGLISAQGGISTSPKTPTINTSTSVPPITTDKPTTTTTIPTIPSTTPPLVTTTARANTTSATPLPVTTTTSRSFTDSIITVAPTPTLPASCNSSGDCPVNHICMLLTSTSISGSCQPVNPSQEVCPASPAQPCTVHSDCKTPEFSYCLLVKATQQTVCTGFGRPGTATECKNGITGTGSGSTSSNVGTTLTYAGIAVGGVALLGIVFALVRWQRRRQRSKMPKSMFGDVDYGVSNRRSAGLGNLSAAAGGAGGGGGGGDQYPFSSRPHAQEDNYNYDDNYYEADGYNNNMHPMTGMAGGAKMNDPYYGQGHGQDAYYDDQYYAKEGYGNNGYDQNGQYVNNQDGFYDTQNMQAAAGYDNYQYPDQQYDQYGNQYDQYGQYSDQQGLQQGTPAGGQQGYSLTDGPATSGAAGITVPPEAAVRATSPRHQATGDYAMDHYAVEPSELDFGGDTKGGPQGGYGRKY